MYVGVPDEFLVREADVPECFSSQLPNTVQKHAAKTNSFLIVPPVKSVF
jgi:hypothetical protein